MAEVIARFGRQKEAKMSDLISRQAAIKVLCENGMCGDENCNDFPCKDVKAIMRVPTIDPVRHGTWLKYPGDLVSDDGLWGETLYDCSECGHTRHVATEFCSKCGAKMEQDGEIQVMWKLEAIE